MEETFIDDLPTFLTADHKVRKSLINCLLITFLLSAVINVGRLSMKVCGFLQSAVINVNNNYK